MSTLNFPIDSDGLIVDVRLNVDAAMMQIALAGGTIPPSITTKGLIDTGTDITAVSASALKQLGVSLQLNTYTHGIGGAMSVKLFRITLFVLNMSNPSPPWMVFHDLLVMELPGQLPFDVLIGMDIIRTCKMLVDGPGGVFSLEF